MKHTLILRSFMFALAVLALGACSKYEEGSPSILSKRSRLINHWKTISLTSNGADITSWNLVTEVIIRKDNTITVIGQPFGVPTSAEGGWVFNGNKTRVLVTNNDGSLDDYEIVMLEKDESKFRRTDANGNVLVYPFMTY